MRRVTERVSLEEARRRLDAWKLEYGRGPWRAATLAGVIWPDTRWRAEQGAGAAASRVLKRLECRWVSKRERGRWGWEI